MTVTTIGSHFAVPYDVVSHVEAAVATATRNLLACPLKRS